MPKTPTTRATWFNNGLVHHALVQPSIGNDHTRCDLLVACSGFERCVISANLRPHDNIVTCLSCLGTGWEVTLERMEREGGFKHVENIETDGMLHRILMEGGAFAPSALRSTRR